MTINRNSLDLLQKTPYALELAVADAGTVLANTSYQTLTSLQGVATLDGLDTHPLVGKKYPGITPDPLTWPANKSDVVALSENWELRVPAGYNPVGDPAALVVVVNQAGATYDATFPASQLDEQANTRGWFALSVKCITETTWGGELACLSLDAALRSVCAAYNIDQRRIYFVAASRGGSVVARYACTRQAGHSFVPAGVVLVSPSCEMREWWSKLPPSTGTGLPGGVNDNFFQNRSHVERPDNMDGAWGDSAAVNHRFRTSSPLHFTVGSYAEYPDFTASTGASVDVSRSIGVCLKQIQTWLIYDPNDALVTFPNQADKLFTMLNGMSGSAACVRTITSVATGFHGFSLLDVAGGVTSSAIMDFFDGLQSTRYPTVAQVVACDDTDYGFVRPFRADVNDTARWTMLHNGGGVGYLLTNVTRLSRLDFDVSKDSLLRASVGTIGTPFTVSSDAGVTLRLKNLAWTPTVVNGTGILAGGANVGYSFGLDGTNSVEIQPAAVGTPMSVSFY